ncbi:MAG: polysaccharide export protein [Sphaerospermopsis sp. SIO1G2]|nr:polysaccharide export protein [Sphaerospermopsis sp. SIO1G2]
MTYMRYKNIAITMMMGLLVTFAGCTQRSVPPSGEMLPPYRLGAGDVVRLIVSEEALLSEQFSVDGQGMLHVPYIGAVKAAGYTVSELQATITEKLAASYLRDPDVVAEITTYRDIYVLGEVRAPGAYPYVPGMTGLSAVATAQGFSAHANTEVVQLRRPSPSGEAPSAQDAALVDYIQPGDTLIVQRRWF